MPRKSSKAPPAKPQSTNNAINGDASQELLTEKVKPQKLSEKSESSCSHEVPVKDIQVVENSVNPENPNISQSEDQEKLLQPTVAVIASKPEAINSSEKNMSLNNNNNNNNNNNPSNRITQVENLTALNIDNYKKSLKSNNLEFLSEIFNNITVIQTKRNLLDNELSILLYDENPDNNKLNELCDREIKPKAKLVTEVIEPHFVKSAISCLSFGLINRDRKILVKHVKTVDAQNNNFSKKQIFTIRQKWNEKSQTDKNLILVSGHDQTSDSTSGASGLKFGQRLGHIKKTSSKISSGSYQYFQILSKNYQPFCQIVPKGNWASRFFNFSSTKFLERKIIREVSDDRIKIGQAGLESIVESENRKGRYSDSRIEIDEQFWVESKDMDESDKQEMIALLVCAEICVQNDF